MAKVPVKKLSIPSKGNLPKGVPGVDCVSAATTGFTLLMETFKEYNQIKQTEETKRGMIRAQRDVALERIKAQKEILQQYLQNSFGERANNFQKMFEILDEGLATGNDKAIGAAMNMIVKQMEMNPLEGIGQLMSCNVVDQIDDPNIDAIDI